MDEDRSVILFITDDPALGAMFRLRLQKDDYAVTWIRSAELDEVLPDVSADLVYFDLDSARPTVASVLFRLRRSPGTRNRPLILVSRTPEEQLRKQLPLIPQDFVLALYQFESLVTTR
jgi:DNA-binding response OmpR family regulator